MKKENIEEDKNKLLVVHRFSLSLVKSSGSIPIYWMVLKKIEEECF
jgi:hypothetical protein